jgi:hypothetical protein
VRHLSRHFLRLQASHVAWLPGPPPGPPDADGVVTMYKLFAVGTYVEDVQVRWRSSWPASGCCCRNAATCA